MTLEVHIRESVIAHAITQWVQARLFTQCVPTPLPVIVDHLDTVPESVAFAQLADGSIEVSVAVRVFVVLEPDLRANPGAPASHPATGDIVTKIILGIRDRALVIVDATAPPTAGLPAEAAQTVNDQLAELKGQQLFDVAARVSGGACRRVRRETEARRDTALTNVARHFTATVLRPRLPAPLARHPRRTRPHRHGADLRRRRDHPVDHHPLRPHSPPP